jgi:mono/diheme cytochrome c family protein
MTTFLKALALVIGVLILIAFGMAVWIGSRGISARAEPGAVEMTLARTMRRLAIPAGDRDRRNPVEGTPDIVAAGLTHYADHCASCHGNDGGGDTEIGRGLYPKPPDMRQAATQSLTDGELFYIIENGIRLSGMPAFGSGTPESAIQTWHLVHFIRALPKLTPEQIDTIAGMTPRSPAQLRREAEEQRFLEGGEPPSPAAPDAH